ncbi:hypothetical protein P8452_08150 [Trifolium repens]|nr:hypothetical protein P8452_08150 [Trifolium repens]
MNLSSNISETFKGIGRTPQSRSPPSLARVPKEEAQQYLTSNDFRKIESLEESKANYSSCLLPISLGKEHNLSTSGDD